MFNMTVSTLQSHFGNERRVRQARAALKNGRGMTATQQQVFAAG
jgi:hypothetical protein